MSKTIRLLCFFLILISCCCCKNNTDTKRKTPLKKIVFSNRNVDILYNNEIADSTSILKLETRKESLIGEISKMYMTDSLIIIYDQIESKISIFDNRGSFIRNIGSKGKGPSEFIQITDMCFYPDSKQIEVFDIQLRKLLCYNINGDLLYVKRSKYDFLSFYRTKKGYWVYSSFDTRNPDKCNLLFLSNNLKTIKSEYCPAENFYDRSNNHDNFVASSNGDLFFHYGCNDTIYKLNEKDAIPFLYVDFENRKVPYNKLSKLTSRQEYDRILYFNKVRFGNLSNLLIEDNLMFFSCSKYSLESTPRYCAYCKLDSLNCRFYKEIVSNFPYEISPKCIFKGKMVFLIYPCYLNPTNIKNLKKIFNVDVEYNDNPMLLFFYEKK